MKCNFCQTQEILNKTFRHIFLSLKKFSSSCKQFYKFYKFLKYRKDSQYRGFKETRKNLILHNRKTSVFPFKFHKFQDRDLRIFCIFFCCFIFNFSGQKSAKYCKNKKRSFHELQEYNRIVFARAHNIHLNLKFKPL